MLSATAAMERTASKITTGMAKVAVVVVPVDSITGTLQVNSGSSGSTAPGFTGMINVSGGGGACGGSGDNGCGTTVVGQPAAVAQLG